MNYEKKYTISELKNALNEERSEFKPKIGGGVIRTDAKNNTKAVKDIMKETGAKEDNMKRETNPENIYDTNKTTIDVNFDYAPSKEYKEKVEAQINGFPSKKNEENNKNNKDIDNKSNKEFYKERKKISSEQNKKMEDLRHSGISSHNLPKDNFKSNTIFKNESKKMKKLHFKNTIFLSEEQVIKKIPDDYKTDGNRFIMEDKNGAKYIIECKVDDNLNFTKINASKYISPEDLKNEVKHAMHLSEYNSSKCQNSVKNRVNEDKEFNKLMKMVRENKKK